MGSRLLFLVAALSILCARVSFAGSCPADTLLGVETFQSAAGDSAGSIVGSYGAAYDLVAGTLTGKVGGVVDFYVQVLIAHDEYVVTGLATGTAVSFDLVLDGALTVSGPATIGFGARSDAGAYVSRSGGPSWTGSLTLHLEEAAEVPFDLRYWIGGGIGANGVLASARAVVGLHFIGLPHGTQIASCQGYQQSSVPAVASTWGKVKSAYR